MDGKSFYHNATAIWTLSEARVGASRALLKRAVISGLSDPPLRCIIITSKGADMDPDIRMEEGRCLKLGDDAGGEVWLDLTTGLIHTLPPLAHTSALMRQVCAAMEEERLATTRLNETTLRLTLDHETGHFDFHFITNEELYLITLLGQFPAKAPADRRVAVAEAMTRINYLLGLGNFEMDFADGELRYRITIDVEEGVVSSRMIVNMLSCAFMSMGHYHDALMKVTFGGFTPAAALSSIQ